MIRRAAATIRAVMPSIDIEDLIGLLALAGLWYSLDQVSNALAWGVVSVIGLVVAFLVALRRGSHPPQASPPPPGMSSEQLAALMGRRSTEG